MNRLKLPLLDRARAAFQRLTVRLTGAQQEKAPVRMAACDLAQHLGIDANRVLAAARTGQGDAALMLRMLEAHGSDAGALERLTPAIVSTMVVACATCNDKTRCEADLDSGVATVTCPEFCPNAARIADISGSNAEKHTPRHSI